MPALKSGAQLFLLQLSALCMTGVWGCKQGASTENTDIVDASLETFGCREGCELELLSPCTCGTDDPCGWRHDGICDRKCLFNNIVDNMFDDAQDCPGPCDGACEAGYYTTCSCAVNDPCKWADDDDCDIQCLEDENVDTMFDDSADCPAYFDDAGTS